jgi:hypothetical protein
MSPFGLGTKKPLIEAVLSNACDLQRINDSFIGSVGSGIPILLSSNIQ